MSGEEIALAIRRARYNEAVIVQVGGEEESQSRCGGDARNTEIVLVACLDKENGGVMWQNAALAHGTDEEDDVGIARHLRTKRWALPMLNDHRRNELYSEAIRAACRQTVTKRSGHDGDDTVRILDIGTGTGLLAMMGAKFALDAISEIDNGGMEVNVTSVEMAGAMARLARMTIDSNELSDTIAVVEEHSMDPSFVLDDARFVDSSPKLASSNGDESMGAKADICTSELLESGLLGEGVLPSLRDAWRRHLKPDAIVVPRRARVIAVLVEGLPLDVTIGDEGVGPNSATAFVGPNVDAFSKVSHGVRLSTSAHGESVLLGDALVPVHADAMLVENAARKLRPLSDPTQVLDFDFKSECIPSECGRTVARDVVPTEKGTVHGVLFWWELELIDGGTVYSTEPMAFANDKSKYQWQDHWQQCLFIFGYETEVSKGGAVELTSRHDDKSISFSIEQASRDRPNQRRKLNENGNLSISPESDKLISPFRALQLNDCSRTRTYRESIQYCLNAKGGLESPVLDLSDFGFCALVAAQLGARSVTSLESSSGNVPTIAATIAQIGNGLPKPGAAYQVIQAQAEHIAVEHIAGGSPAEIVVAEPYYEVLEGWHVQEALNFYYLVQSMRSRGVISQAALCVPSHCSIMARVVQFDDFHCAYSSVGDEDEEIHGFNHSKVNDFGDRYRTYDIALPLWQYRLSRLSEPSRISRLSYEGGDEGQSIEATEIVVSKRGVACAIELWVDYACRIGDGDFKTVSTSSPAGQQLVRKLDERVAVEVGDKFSIKVRFGDDDPIESYAMDIEIPHRITRSQATESPATESGATDAPATDAPVLADQQVEKATR